VIVSAMQQASATADRQTLREDSAAVLAQIRALRAAVTSLRNDLGIREMPSRQEDLPQRTTAWAADFTRASESRASSASRRRSGCPHPGVIGAFMASG
jgi:hypothetical protein